MRRSLVPRLLGMLLAAGLARPLLVPAPVLATRTERVACGLGNPLFATSPAGDERRFIIEPRGVIKIRSQGQVLPTPFLDIQTLVLPASQPEERGLLGLAFDPDYASNRHFYVTYLDRDGRTVVARYRASAANPDRALPGSGLVLLDHLIAVGEVAASAPPPLALSPAAPNPFTSSTRVPFALASPPRHFTAAIYSATGRRVIDLVPPAAFPAANGALEWNGRDARGRPYPAGVYWLRVEADGVAAQERLVLVR